LSALNQVIEYLQNKISKVNLNNQKANRGGVLIKTHKGWEEKLERMVSLSFQIIQSQFSRNNTTYTIGECGLTYCSMSIGEVVARIAQREPLKNKRDQLALGDLMIEGFVYHGFADTRRPIKGSERGRIKTIKNQLEDPDISRELKRSLEEALEELLLYKDNYILFAAPKWVELADLPDSLIELTVVGSTEERPAAPERSIHKMHDHLFDAEADYVKALHNLQQVKWSINQDVLATVLANKHLFVNDEVIADNDAKEQRRRSKVIEWKFITAKASILKDWDGFYQLMDVDYRGRMYNVEPFLNYQGNDLAKGMLQFYEPKLINEDGKFWLAVHTAASYNQSYHKDELPEWCEADYKSYLEDEGLEDISVDKMTLNDRANWTTNNWDKIFACELDMKAEKPVTFLACCYEWIQISETGYTSIPVSIDGSNNGWQHLGAISKDTQTGELVGLTPVGIQKDFYVQTAKELIELAKKDERLTSILSSMPMKHIRKGISKRGSMTRAYSAGAGKIAENMFFDCKTEDFHEMYGITLKDCGKFAKLLVKAIENVCPGPLETMAYLQKLASYQLGKHELVGCKNRYKELQKLRKELSDIKDPTDEELDQLDDIVKELNGFNYELIYGEGDNSMTWTTPSGFTALYEKYTMEDLEPKPRVTLNGKIIRHVLKTPTDRPDVQGFMCGISPNYIHSMDAAHMALVIADWDGAFGAVHDSFSTHANDVDQLLQRTKDVFIEMYQHDNYFDVIRENLTNNNDDVEQPALGTLDIGEINDSEYFFA